MIESQSVDKDELILSDVPQEAEIDLLDMIDLQIHQTNRRHIAPQSVPDNFWKPKVGLAISDEELKKAGLKRRFAIKI